MSALPNRKTITIGTQKIGISFGDNDFYYTCCAFLKLLIPDDDFTHPRARELTFTKAQIVELFNRMAPSLYMLKQNAWRDGIRTFLPNVDSYLTIDKEAVYLDYEVDQYMTERPNGDNGEFFAVDFAAAYVWAF